MYSGGVYCSQFSPGSWVHSCLCALEKSLCFKDYNVTHLSGRLPRTKMMAEFIHSVTNFFTSTLLPTFGGWRVHLLTGLWSPLEYLECSSLNCGNDQFNYWVYFMLIGRCFMLPTGRPTHARQMPYHWIAFENMECSVWLHTSVSPAFGRPKQEDYKFKAILG